MRSKRRPAAGGPFYNCKVQSLNTEELFQVTKRGNSVSVKLTYDCGMAGSGKMEELDIICGGPLQEKRISRLARAHRAQVYIREGRQMGDLLHGGNGDGDCNVTNGGSGTLKNGGLRKETWERSLAEEGDHHGRAPDTDLADTSRVKRRRMERNFVNGLF